MAATLLQKARRAFIRRRYNDVITLLESEVIQYRDSFTFYYILGLACLHTGDIGGASSYFQRARQIKMRDPDLLAAQAALFLRKGDLHQAVDYYLEILEYAPEHRLAKAALRFIRTKGNEDNLAMLCETGRIKRFYPTLRAPSTIIKPLVILGIASLVLFVALNFKNLFANPFAGETRADLSSLDLNADDTSSMTDTGGSYRYILTDSEILSAYSKARTYFQSWKDNAAQVEVNRLLFSNASIPIKQKARMLMSYFGKPGFDSITDSYPYAQIAQDPYLYLDCWISWKGMATNLVETDQTVEFDLLVGYDSRSKLEGIVPVRYESYFPIDTEHPLEVLAQITLVNGKIALKGEGVYQTAIPAQK